MKNICALCLGLLACVQSLSATAQSPDCIIYETQFLPLFSNPLEDYPWPKGSAPEFEIQPNTRSTGNYRGYIALWEVAGGKLYLKGIDSYLPIVKTKKIGPFGIFGYMTERVGIRATLPNLFGVLYQDGRVFANWYTGILVIPDGDLLEYVHAGYGSTYEREIHITVDHGLIKEVKEKYNKKPK